MNYIKLIRILVLVCVLVPFSNATVVNNQAESFTTSDSINIAYDVYYDNAVNNAPMLVISPAFGSALVRVGQRDTADYFAQLGYFVINVDTRGKGASGGVDNMGAKKCIELTEVFTDVKTKYPSYTNDLKYIGGGSGGGGTAMQCITRYPDFFNGAFSMFGLSNYSLWWVNFPIYRTDIEGIMDSDTPLTEHEKYESRNSYFGVQNINTPLIMMHNAGDTIVGVIQSRQMNTSLKSLDKDVEYYENSIIHGEVVGHSYLDNISLFLETKTNNINLQSKDTLKVLGTLFTKSFGVDYNNVNKVGDVIYNRVVSDEDNYILTTRSYTGSVELSFYNKEPSTTYYLTYQDGSYIQNISNSNGDVYFLIDDLGDYVLSETIQDAINEYSVVSGSNSVKIWSRKNVSGKVVVQ